MLHIILTIIPITCGEQQERVLPILMFENSSPKKSLTTTEQEAQCLQWKLLSCVSTSASSAVK